MAGDAPTLYEWAGGTEAFERLTEVFWLAEAFGGPARYTEEHGGHPHMLSKHRNLGLTEEQRRRWVSLICDAADEAGLPTDPEFARPSSPTSSGAPGWRWLPRGVNPKGSPRSAQPGATPPAKAPVPRWGWGEAPPYTG